MRVGRVSAWNKVGIRKVTAILNRWGKTCHHTQGMQCIGSPGKSLPLGIDSWQDSISKNFCSLGSTTRHSSKLRPEAQDCALKPHKQNTARLKNKTNNLESDQIWTELRKLKPSGHHLSKNLSSVHSIGKSCTRQQDSFL